MMREVALSLFVFVAACGSPKGDTFVDAPNGGGEIAQWMATPDGRLKVPLVRGLAWQSTTAGDALVAVRAPEGPTFVEVTSIDGIEPPFDRLRCATTHRQRIMIALAAKGIESTTPDVAIERRHGEDSPRLHYAVALVASNGAPPASSLSAWGYFVDGERCLGLGVTTIVRAKSGTTDQPDADDLQRLERVFGVAMDGAALQKRSSAAISPPSPPRECRG